MHIEERVGRDFHADEFLDAGGQADLIRTLDGQETVLERRAVSQGIQLTQAAEVGLPALACDFVAQGAELRVAAADPAARRDAVSDVHELALPELVEAREQIRTDEARVQFGHAVHVMRADDGEVRHADTLRETFLHDRELRLAGVIARPALLDALEVAAVDLVDDLEVARQDFLKERHGPGLKGLRQQGVVGIAEDLRAEPPGFVPSQALDVDQQAHQFRHSDGRVRIIELHGSLGRQVIEVGVGPAMAAQDILQGAGHEEDLLDETELLAALCAVVRVEDLRDDLTRIALMHGFDVTAAIESAEVEFGSGLGFPEAEEIDAAAREAGDRDIPRHTEEVAGLDEFGAMVTTVVGAVLHAAIERHADAIVGAANQPRVVVRQPVVGDFDLAALREGLAEETELIVDTITDGRDVHRGEGIEKARGEATEATVAEAHVGFFVSDGFEVLTEVGQGCRGNVT